MNNKVIKELTPELLQRRKEFFEKYNKEFPPITDFIATASGTIMALPETPAAWEEYKENLQFVEGAAGH